MLKHMCNIGIWLFGVSSLFGQDKATFSLQQIMSSPFPTSLIASPQTDHIAWVSNQEGKRSIWVVDQPGSTPEQLIIYPDDDGQELSQLSFTPNGQKIVFVRGGAPNRQGYIPNPNQFTEKASRTIQIIDCSSKIMQQVGSGSNPVVSPNGKILIYVKNGDVWKYDIDQPGTPSRLFFHARGGINQLRWSPNGQMVAFVSRRGTHSFIGVFDIAKSQLSYLSPSLFHDEDPVWSPNGDRLAFRRSPNESDPFLFIPRRSGNPWSIIVYDFAQQNEQPIWTAPHGMGSVFRNISSSNQLYWMADDQIIFPWEGDGWTHLYRIPATGGEPTLITPGNFEVQYVSSSMDRQSITWSGNQNDPDRQHIWQANAPDYNPLVKSAGNSIEWAPILTGKTKVLYALGTTAKHPAAPVQLKNGKGVFLPNYTLPKDFPLELLTTPEPVTFPAADGLTIHGQLFKPPNWDDGQKRPALLFFHGGSRRQMLLGFHHRGYYHNAYAMNQYLANQGYFVLSVNYRSGIGYGMAFREALNYGAAGASEFNDVMGAGLFLQNLEGIDREKLGLWGGSYGGYLTALGLAKASHLFQAGVDIHGVHDWNVVIKNFRPKYVPEKYPDFAERAFRASPMAFLDTWESPVLIIHGDDDRNVPFSESVDLAESLQDRKIYFEQLVFPDEVHGFLLHKNWLKAYEATADFFDRMLKQP